MMKKNGFTLAEVLITLAIIGVVATLTLPSLISNTQEQQAVTGFRKAMNTLNEVAQMNVAVDGFDYGNIADGTTVPGSGSIYSSTGILNSNIWAMMSARAQVDTTRSNSAANVYGANAAGACNDLHVIGFRDGTMLCYAKTTTNAASNAVIYGYVDTNGIKRPNTISTCGDVACGQGTSTARNIKDQFAITLFNTSALPGHIVVTPSGEMSDKTNASNMNNAARWAMNK